MHNCCCSVLFHFNLKSTFTIDLKVTFGLKRVSIYYREVTYFLRFTCSDCVPIDSKYESNLQVSVSRFFLLWPFLSQTPGTIAPPASITKIMFSVILVISCMILLDGRRRPVYKTFREMSVKEQNSFCSHSNNNNMQHCHDMVFGPFCRDSFVHYFHEEGKYKLWGLTWWQTNRDSWLIFEIIDLKKYSEKYPMAIDAGA